MPLSPRKARHFPPYAGEADAKEKRNYSFYYLNTLLTISYAGFFAKGHIIFFFSYHHSDSACRSRMTAEVNCVLRMKLNGS